MYGSGDFTDTNVVVKYILTFISLFFLNGYIHWINAWLIPHDYKILIRKYGILAIFLNQYVSSNCISYQILENSDFRIIRRIHSTFSYVERNRFLIIYCVKCPRDKEIKEK